MIGKYMTCFAVVLSLFLAAPAMAEMSEDNGPEASLDQLRLVSGYLVSDQFIISRLKLRRLDKDPVPELMNIATDAKKKVFVRERAFKCLSLFNDKRSKGFLEGLLSKNPDRYFNIVMMSYLEAFGEDGVKKVSPHLASPKPEVRAAVVKGLGIFGGQEGFEILQAHETTERDPTVLSQLKAYIQ